MTFDQPTIRATRVRLQTALDALGKDLGCEFKVGKATYERDGSRCSFKLDSAVLDEDGTVQSKEAADFVRCAKGYGLFPEDLGRSFTANGKTFTIIGCMPRSHRYPILVKRGDGKQRKISAEAVAAALGPCADPEREAARQNAMQ